MEIYGTTGSIRTEGAGGLQVHLEGKSEEPRQAAPIAAPHDDFLHYFAAVARGQVQPSGLSSLRNLVVTEILEAARRSAETGRTVYLA